MISTKMLGTEMAQVGESGDTSPRIDNDLLANPNVPNKKILCKIENLSRGISDAYELKRFGEVVSKTLKFARKNKKNRFVSGRSFGWVRKRIDLMRSELDV